MRKQTEITELLQTVGNLQGEGFQYDEAAITAEYATINANRSGIAVKVLIILGGILATLAFLGFLLVAGLYDSETGLTITGYLFIGGSLLLKKLNDKLILDTFSVTFFITGCCLVLMGSFGTEVSPNNICLLFMGIGLLSIIIVQNYVMVLVGSCIFHAALIALIGINASSILPIEVYISLMIVAFTFLVLKEASIVSLSKKFSKLYNPLRMGTLVALIGAVYVSGRPWIMVYTAYSPLYWLSGAVAIAAILLLVPRILKILKQHQLPIMVAILLLTALVLAPTFRAPSIPISVLIMLLSFMVNFKTGFVAGIIALICFLSEFYYDLGITLLTKSLMMMGSGFVFLLFYFLIHKKLRTK